jgi:heme-degrading monooxygenase HmoA
LFLSGICAALLACGGENGNAPSQSPRCARDVLEADLEATPMSGVAVDDSGELNLESGRTYVVSSTYGAPVPGSDGAPVTEQYLELFSAVQVQLQQQPGLLAMQLASSEGCASGRTLAIWESEEAMYDFVISPAHAAAMAAAGQVLKPGYGVTHWSATKRSEMNFDQAVRELAKK